MTRRERLLAVVLAVLLVLAPVGSATAGFGGVRGGDAGAAASAGSGPGGNGTGGNETGPGNGTGGNGSGPPANRTPGNGTNRSAGGPPVDRGPPGDRDCDGGDCDGRPAWARRAAESLGPTADRGGRPGDAGVQSPVRNVTGGADAAATGNATNGTVSVENGTALALRRAAYDLLGSTDLTPGGGHAGGGGQAARLQRWLNRSFRYYLDERRVTDAAVFADDRRVAGATTGRAPAVGAYLAASDRALARTALADARRVRRLLDERNRSYDESTVAEEIAAAADALARGERLHDRSAPAAISAYRESWLHAQRALDVMDRAVAPNVTLDSRRDPPRNGTESYVLRGSVFDVRGHELHPLALTLDGETYRVALDVDTEPGSVGRFAVNLTLAPGSHRVRVTATDSNRDWGDDDRGPPANGSALLRLDGDGLPDRFEIGVVRTDPLDADSNASTTARNESGNGVLDGLEDHDRDGAATYDEYVQGTEPLDPDTDGDDLPDGFELRYASLDPRTEDTDGDGVPDPREDPDDDTLTIAAELGNRSSPFYADTEADGLRDDAELRNGTDPVDPDTDRDGLLDADELGLPTDPTDPDSDGDGVPDGAETFTTRAANESAGAAVNVTGEGNVADGVTIRNTSVEAASSGDAANATVSNTVSFEADRAFDNATLSLSYDENRVSDENESDLAVYRWDPDRQTYVRVESTVNRSAGTVSAETEHFSTYTVLNSAEWGDFEQTSPDPQYALDENFGDLSGWDCEAGTCRTEDGSAVIGTGSSSTSSDALAVDGEHATHLDGQSIDYSAGNDSNYTTQGGCIQQRPDGPGGGGTLTTTSTTTADPTTTTTKPCYGPSPTSTTTTTPGSDPIETIPPSELARKIEIPADAVSVELQVTASAVARKRNAEATLSVVTESGTETLLDVQGEEGDVVRDEVSTTLDLTEHAGETLAVRARTENNSSIELSYLAIEIERDSDGDGLINSEERLGFRTGWDGRVYTDPYSRDSDGDGLSDGREVGRFVESSTLAGGYYLLESNPSEVDSDGDGLSDHEEMTEPLPYAVTRSRQASVDLLQAADPGAMQDHLATDEAWADPMRADTDDDGLDDRAELLRRTNVGVGDSDGDGTDDGAELRQGSDPTLFDARPPEVEVRYAAFDVESSLEFVGTEYRLIYVVEDPSGVQRTRVVKKGEVRYAASWPADDLPRHTQRDAYFRTGVFETAISSLTGTTVEVRATDGHGNQRRMTGLERATFYSRVAVRVADEDDIYAEEVAATAGQVSGFAASLGATADSIKAFAEDPLGFLDSLQQLMALLDQLGLLDRIIEAIAKDFAQKQAQNNPYDESENPELYKRFKYNWYAGYVVGFVAKAAVGASATKALKSTKTFQRVSKYVGSSRVGTVYKAVESPVDAGKARVAAKIVDGADRASPGVVRHSKSVGATYRVWRLQRRVDVCDDGLTVASTECDYFDDLSPAEQRQVARVLGRAGDDGSYVLKQLDDVESREQFFKLVQRGEMDGQDVKAMARMLRGEEEYVSDSTTIDDLLTVGREGDLSQTIMVLKHDGSPRWLELGDSRRGLKHLLKEHGEQFIEDQSYIDNVGDIKSYIRKTVEDGDSYEIPKSKQGGTAYELKVRKADPEQDDEFITVIVGDNGYIVTARPGNYQG